MRKILLTAWVAAFGFASPAYAAPVTFTVGDYTVNAFNEIPGDLGLDISIEELLATGASFDLDFVGDTHQVDLFKIWTDEGARAQGDDVVHKTISVTMPFTAPSTGGVLQGETFGTSFLFASWGVVEWLAPIELTFGTTGKLGIQLFGTTFGGEHSNFLGLDGPGIVKAKFKLLQEDTVAPVPEPGTLALFGSGLAMAASRLRKRKK